MLKIKALKSSLSEGFHEWTDSNRGTNYQTLMCRDYPIANTKKLDFVLPLHKPEQQSSDIVA